MAEMHGSKTQTFKTDSYSVFVISIFQLHCLIEVPSYYRIVSKNVSNYPPKKKKLKQTCQSKNVIERAKLRYMNFFLSSRFLRILPIFGHAQQ